MGRYCTKCGTVLEDDARFCRKCGAEVRSPEDLQPASSMNGSNNAKRVIGRKLTPAVVIAIVICSVAVIAVVLWALLPKDSKDLPLNAGSNQSSNNNETSNSTPSISGNEQSNDNNKKNISDFSNAVCGIWILMDEDNPYSSVSFLIITYDLHMTGGVYPGSYGQTCDICEIQKNVDGSYRTVLHYLATEATDMDDAMPEFNTVMTFSSEDGYNNSLILTNEDGSTNEYIFAADDFEQATIKFDQFIEEKNRSSLESGIPKISASSKILDADFETLKIRMGYDLSGPNDGWRSNSESIFYLTNITDVDCYMNISSSDELIGVKNGEIVFFGIYGLTSSSTRVKDLLPNDALSTEPAIYTIRANTAAKAGLDSYIWKLDNGYMAAVVIPMSNMSFYDQYVYNVVYITDLTYLSYMSY